MRTVLVVAPTASVRTVLRRMLSRGGWNVTEARTWSEAAPLLRDAEVVIIEQDLPEGGWMSALNSANGPPLIVTAARPDAHLWADVIQAGGHDVLAQPFDETEAVHGVRAAAGVISGNKQPHATHIQSRCL